MLHENIEEFLRDFLCFPHSIPPRRVCHLHKTDERHTIHCLGFFPFKDAFIASLLHRDVAHGLNYIHNKIEDERRIIHRDIKSGNILLTENWEAKIADFGLSKFHPKSQQRNTLYTEHIAGTKVYLDPEYDNTGKLKNETDIYSFGVVLFEVLSGRFANDLIYTKEDSNGFAPVARRRFNEGTIKEIVDPRLLEETHESVFTLNKGPDQDSLDAFSKIAYQCVAENQAGRPTAEVIIKKLEEALSFQVSKHF